MITIIAFGTRGDVAPSIALAKALREKGHPVRILASVIFKDWIESHGISALVSSVNIQELMESAHAIDWVERGHNPLVENRVMKKLVSGVGMSMANEAFEATKGSEAVVSSFTSDVCVASIAEKLKIPHISIRFQPSLVATRSGAASMHAPFPDRESIFNYYFGKLILETAYWRWYGKGVNDFREQTLGLPRHRPADLQRCLADMLVLHAFSPTVVPHARDWPKNLHPTGFWFLQDDKPWSPPASLQEFLAGGEKPVSIGFGSMTGRNAQTMSEIIFEAARLSKKRVIFLSGWMGNRNVRDHADVFMLDYAPHDWLFPKVACTVHHGGSGTTGRGSWSGMPQVIVPCFVDQPFWARRIRSLGASPEPIRRYQLTAQNLAAAIRQACTDSSIQQAAKNLGMKIHAENGLERVCQLN